MFSTLWMKGQLLHRERAHVKVPGCSLAWNKLLTKKLPMSLSRLNEISGGCEKIGLAGFLKIMRSYYKQRDKFGIAVLIYFILCYICSSYQNTQNNYRRNDSLNISLPSSCSTSNNMVVSWQRHRRLRWELCHCGYGWGAGGVGGVDGWGGGVDGWGGGGCTVERNTKLNLWSKSLLLVKSHKHHKFLAEISVVSKCKKMCYRMMEKGFAITLLLSFFKLYRKSIAMVTLPPSLVIPCTHLQSWEEKGTVREVYCPRTLYNNPSKARIAPCRLDVQRDHL